VIPKIEASRDADAPDVHEVVTKVAERNPQKLRQIGLNYDIANAKGFTELPDEEKRKQEQKKKDAADEKKKADFDAWRQEEKAGYEAWKKEKSLREAKDKPMEDSNNAETKKDEVKKDSASVSAQAPQDAASPATVAGEKTDETAEVKQELANTKAIEKDTNAKAAVEAKAVGKDDKLDIGALPEAHTHTTASHLADGPNPARSMYGRLPESTYGQLPESVYGDVPPPPPPPEKKSDPTTHPSLGTPSVSWVCGCIAKIPR
jgi:hypothetical protein